MSDLTFAALCVLALLQFADAVTTSHILSLGGRELNPILAKLFERYDPAPVLAIKGALVMLFAIWLGSPAPEAMCGLYVLVVCWNLRVICRLADARRAGAEEA